MKRDISRLEEGPFDLPVIVGGIYDAWTALDAAHRRERPGRDSFLHQGKEGRAGTWASGAYSKKGFCRFSRPMVVAAS